MADEFQAQSTLLDSPARDAFAVTPNDDTDLDAVTRSVYVGGEGDLSVIMYSGAEVVFPGAVGNVPICVRRIKATGTTATGIVGLR